LGRDVCEVVKSVLEGEGLGATMKEGAITLLYKEGDRKRLENYRQITLLCVDYKIVARVLVGRLKRALPHVIHEDQTCGVEGRLIQWNLGLVRDCIHWVKKRKVN